MTRILFQAAVVLFGIVVGCATGGYLTFHRYARDYQTLRAFAWTGIFSAVSENQYDQNTTDAKKELQVLLDIFKQETNSTAIDV